MNAVTTAMGLSLDGGRSTETPERLRVNLSGEGAEWLVRRRGEALNALQHIVSAVFRDDMPEGQRVVGGLPRASARTRTPSCGRWRSSWPRRP